MFNQRNHHDDIWLNAALLGWILALVLYLTEKILYCIVAILAVLNFFFMYINKLKIRVNNRNMFGKKISSKSSPISEPVSLSAPSWIEKSATLIAKSTVFTGDIDVEGDIHIWGKITGNIRVKEGSIHVMEAGEVEGELLAPEIIIDGKVEGTCCAAKLDILEHGALYGISRCAGMTIQRGGQFIGQSEYSGQLLSQNNENHVFSPTCSEDSQSLPIIGKHHNALEDEQTASQSCHSSTTNHKNTVISN